MYFHVCMYVQYMYVCMYICTVCMHLQYVCMYVCMYTVIIVMYAHIQYFLRNLPIYMEYNVCAMYLPIICL